MNMEAKDMETMIQTDTVAELTTGMTSNIHQDSNNEKIEFCLIVKK